MKKTKFLAFMLLAFALGFSACSNVNEPDPDTDSSIKLPYLETFDTSLGLFTAQSVSGDQVWAYDTHKYAMITGYVATVNNANEDWLISPEISLEGVTAAKLSFDHVARYFADVKNEATVWVSSNYVTGLPATATWTQLPTKAFVNAADWTLTTSGEISLTAYAGKKIKIAFKYISTATKAGTWEVKNFKVEEGEAVVVDPGTGEVGDTLTVAQALLAQNSEVKWVKGYIVGCVKNGTTEFTGSEQALFTGFDSSTNVFIADTENEKDYTKCLSVKLNDTTAPEGLRSNINLVDHPGNKDKILRVKGTLRSMFTSLPGIRDIVDYKFIAPPAVSTDPNPVTSLVEDFESFTSGTGSSYFSTQPDNKGWKGVGIQGTLQPDVRVYNGNKYVQFSAHRGSITTNDVQEFWLVSPRLDLTSATNKVLSFDMIGGYFNESTIYEVYILDSDNPTTANKTKLEGWKIPTSADLNGQSYTPFISSGSIDLSGHTGVKRIGFYYKGKSGSGNSTTYQLDNFKFGN